MTVYRRSDTGSWFVDILFTHSDGRKEVVRRVSPVQTKRGAEQYERQLRENLLASFDKPLKKVEIPTFAAYSEAFMNDCARVMNKVSELQSKERILKNHLLPAFGKKLVNCITRDDIKAFRNRKLKAGLSAKTINNQTTVLARILGEAVESGLIEFVPKLRRLPVTPTKMDFLTREEAIRLVDFATGQYKTMIQLGLSAGLRQGELLGLEWQDLSLDKGFLIVRQSIFRGHIGSPKSNHSRIVPLNQEVVEALQGLRHDHGPFVFCSASGAPLTDNECKHPLRRACKLAGIRQIGWHCLRHTFASHLVQAGVSILEVQEYLGHSDIRVTMRYAHLDPHIRHDAVEKLPSYRPISEEGIIPIRKAFEN